MSHIDQSVYRGGHRDSVYREAGYLPTKGGGRRVEHGGGTFLHSQEASMRLISLIFSQRTGLERASFSHILTKGRA